MILDSFSNESSDGKFGFPQNKSLPFDEIIFFDSDLK